LKGKPVERRGRKASGLAIFILVYPDGLRDSGVAVSTTSRALASISSISLSDRPPECAALERRSRLTAERKDSFDEASAPFSIREIRGNVFRQRHRAAQRRDDDSHVNRLLVRRSRKRGAKTFFSTEVQE
jgi:hypothetical protein